MKDITLPLLRKNVKKTILIFEAWIIIYFLFSVYRFIVKDYSALVLDVFWLIFGVFLFFSRYTLLKGNKELISKTIMSVDILKRNLLIQKFLTIFLIILFIISLLGLNDSSIGFLLFIVFFVFNMKLIKNYLKEKKIKF